MNEPFAHNPRVAELDRELEQLDAARRAYLAQVRERGRRVMAERADLLMADQLTLRVLNDSPLSAREAAWAEANPEKWAAIKEATRGKRGSRQGQRVSAK